jgi:hypothetical protein
MGFFLLNKFVMYSHNGHHPHQELAKFGYKPERKVQNFRCLVSSYILVTCWNPLSKDGEFKKKSSKYGDFGAFFFHKKPLYPVALIFLVLILCIHWINM